MIETLSSYVIIYHMRRRNNNEKVIVLSNKARNSGLNLWFGAHDLCLIMCTFNSDKHPFK